MDDFEIFIRDTLSSLDQGGQDIVNSIVYTETIESYFRPAFTHKTFLIGQAAKKGKFDYEILEKFGDRILAMSFQNWLVDLMYPDIMIPQIYSDMEKKFTGTDYLSKLSEELKFDKWIKIAEGNITQDIKEDVFEAFIGAICLAGNKYMPDFGVILAKRWIYDVYNTYTLSEIDPKTPDKYIDKRSQVNDVWLFNGWGTPIYKTTGESKASRATAERKGFAAVNLIAPNIAGFPAKLRGKILGSGVGNNLSEAKEIASEHALKTLKFNYSDLKDSEIEFSGLATARLKKVLEPYPDILRSLIDTINNNAVFTGAQFRSAKIGDIFVVQLRIQIDGKWKNGSRSRDRDVNQAYLKAAKSFIKKAENGLTV